MKIVDCVKLKERKDLRKKWNGKRERGRRERRNEKETKRKDRGVTAFS